MTKREIQEQKKLLKQWVFDHAYAMMDEFNMNRSEAFRQAYLVKDLLDALGQGIVVFEYEKKDGSSRLAQGTLCKGVSDEYDAYEYKEKDKENRDCYPKLDIPYWDLDRQAFRNFSAARVVSIHGVVIPSFRENKEHESHESHELIEFV